MTSCIPLEWRQQILDPGFDKENLTAAHILLPAARYPEDSQVSDFYVRALENLQRDYSVESAALVQTIPLTGDNSDSRIRVEGQSDPRQDVPARLVVA